MRVSPVVSLLALLLLAVTMLSLPPQAVAQLPSNALPAADLAASLMGIVFANFVSDTDKSTTAEVRMDWAESRYHGFAVNFHAENNDDYCKTHTDGSRKGYLKQDWDLPSGHSLDRVSIFAGLQYEHELFSKVYETVPTKVDSITLILGHALTGATKKTELHLSPKVFEYCGYIGQSEGFIEFPDDAIIHIDVKKLYQSDGCIVDALSRFQDWKGTGQDDSFIGNERGKCYDQVCGSIQVTNGGRISRWNKGTGCDGPRGDPSGKANAAAFPFIPHRYNPSLNPDQSGRALKGNYKKNTCIHGENQLGNAVPVASMGQCFAACEYNAWCKTADYSEAENKCWLSRCDGRTYDNNEDPVSCSSSSQTTGGSCAPYTLYDKWDRVDIRKVYDHRCVPGQNDFGGCSNEVSFKDCVARCTGESECNTVDYHITNGNCCPSEGTYWDSNREGVCQSYFMGET